MSKYCEYIFKTQRWKTREVAVGNVGVGGNNPVRIQSMTTSNTRDAEATIDQVMRLADAGCEIVRITVQGMKEADACEQIKNGLVKRGYNTPLVADIHFFPPAAMRVIDFVDKVRVNPGNFADKRASFKTIEYDEASYAKELLRIEEKFTPLVQKCKSLKRSIRIGTNHGSLSDRIMNRYGDTPKGMLESALEFARVCRDNDFHDIIFSMKSSNPIVMIQAYRLLVAEMITLGWDYPLHLGVTEAGEGEDGRIKSAMGIGSLLLDGIGDTIRVSLTEDPWNEIAPCQRLVSFSQAYETYAGAEFAEHCRPIESQQRRNISLPKHLSLHRDGTVLMGIQNRDFQDPNFHKKLGYDTVFGLPKLKASSADCLVLTETPQDALTLRHVTQLKEIGVSFLSKGEGVGQLKLTTMQEALERNAKQKELARFNPITPPKDSIAVTISEEKPEDWQSLHALCPEIIILSPPKDRLHYCRHFFDWLKREKIETPVILHFTYSCSKDELVVQSAAEFGALFTDGLGDGLWIDAPYEADFIRNLSFSILQAARMRTFKTDFISCPSCGRTLFDLQTVSKGIRERTAHLPGVKIAIMGCIVNGPGEMADADFGYVGSKPGMIDLYVGKECVEKDISFADAVERLVELIKRHGRWADLSALT